MLANVVWQPCKGMVQEGVLGYQVQVISDGTISNGVSSTWYLPKNPPRCTKKPPSRYQKTPQNVPKKPPNVLKTPPIDVAGIDPHKSYMHHPKHPFYLVVEPCGSHAHTWLQTHTPIPPHTLLLHPIAEACPSQMPPCAPPKHACQTS